MDKLVATLGITSFSKSQVSRMAKDLDEQVAAFRTRPLDETGLFQSLASAIERELVLRGVDVDAQTVDVALNDRIAQAATTYALGEHEAMEKMSHLAVIGYLADSRSTE
jgi:AmiR/NasT family two-component response regulator